ncbi:fused MFS/spermidine synthase [Oricola sp.]|uniref:fused MFS/spermidine synthase n=1 Tax=Oricola sp. TaxID=1979950 RepID=UPI0025DB5A10|nr:fused MFS/spermidine synthase [Oricola sp.]MCI5076413.1 fused MFS/spermidine synthase [Oricola sp.]
MTQEQAVKGPDRARGLPPVFMLVVAQAAVAAASLVVEIVAGRMLAPYLGMSLYTWTSVIAVVLAGFSAGHWAGGRIAEAEPRRALALTGWSMAGAALTAAGATLVLRWSAAPVIGGFGDPIASIAVLTTLAFFLPSFFAGIPAPVLSHVAVLAQPDKAGRALGAMYAASALGAIAGTLLAGFLFISWLGSTGTLAAVTAIYVLLAAALFAAGRGGGRMASIMSTAVLPLGVAALALSRPDPCTRESDYFCIRVIDVTDDVGEPARLMVLDHLGHGIAVRDNPGRLVTSHTAMLDLLARERTPQAGFGAFFIGGGSYSIPRAWTGTGVKARITVAEIDPAVTEVAARDFWFDPATADIRHEDARLALAADPARHDVIIGDAFTDIAVPAHLVTREFFALVADRLTPDGVYLMNVIDHADGLSALAAIARTLREVFPVVEIWAEPNPPGIDERLVFIVLAGRSPTAVAALDGPGPDFIRAARLSPRAVDALVARLDPPVLTDDYAPIDRLMTRFD